MMKVTTNNKGDNLTNSVVLHGINKHHLAAGMLYRKKKSKFIGVHFNSTLSPMFLSFFQNISHSSMQNSFNCVILEGIPALMNLFISTLD